MTRAGKANAALTAASLLLVAGCAGGKLAGGTYQPPVGTNPTIPANSARISLSFTMTRSTTPWSKARQRKNGASVAVRSPKYVSPAVYGGTLVLKIYQNGQQAFSDQVFAVGSTYAYAIYCYGTLQSIERRQQIISTSTTCYNTVNVYAPQGGDQFFVEFLDSGGHMLSVTPGIPGMNTVGSPPAPVSVTSAGANVAIPTSGVVANVLVDNATPCIGYFSYSGASAQIAFLDADGYQVSGAFANPVTMNVSGAWNLLDSSSNPQAGAYVVTSQDGGLYSVYTNSDGASGNIAAPTSPMGNPPINLTQLFAADHVAFVPSAAGLAAKGLAGNGNSFACGNVPMADASTGAAVAFTNPVAIAGDDGGLVAVGDSTGGGPVVKLVDLTQADFGVFSVGGQGLRNAARVESVALPSAAPHEAAMSPTNRKIYVTNGDGSLQVVDYNNYPPFLGGSISLFNSYATGLTNPQGLDVYQNSGFDVVFVADAGSSNVAEIDGASNVSPSLVTHNLYGVYAGGTQLSAATRSSSVSVTGGSTVMIRAYDANYPGGAQTVLVACSTGACSTSIAGAAAGTNQAGPQTTASLAGTFLVANGTSIQDWSAATPPVLNATWLSGLAGAPTRIFTSSDGIWVGSIESGTINMRMYGNATVYGALAGALGTILTL